MGFELTGATPDERLKELTEKLEQGVSEIFTSGRYAEYLSAMSKFHTYSFGNVMLILMQNPAASRVAGFHTWKKVFGRNVKAHENGLKFLLQARIGGSSNRTSWTRTVSPCLMRQASRSGSGRLCSICVFASSPFLTFRRPRAKNFPALVYRN